jgi:hypothetical protein
MSTNVPEDVPSAERLGKQSTSQKLITLALDHYDLHVDPGGKPYGVRKGGHVALPLLGSRRSIRRELGGLYRRHTGRAASQNALAEAMGVLEFEADDGEPVELHLRAARPTDQEIYIDLGDFTERAIRVTPSGWEMLDGDDEIPVLFRRTNVTAPLPTPTRNGSIDALWEFVNLPESDRGLLVGWLVAATILVGLPCPILALLGEQGTAKTSSARRFFSMIDPTSAPVRRPPNNADRLLHAGAHSRSVIFDNLSSIPRWLSDGLCRYVTGESDVDRALYSDDEPRIIRVQGVLGFTGIDVGSLAGDLAERCVWGDLEVIPKHKRRSERELNEMWGAHYPSMVGGLLDLVVSTLQKLPEVKLTDKPRMADFAEVLAALDLAQGWDTLDRYRRAQDAVAEDIVGTDKFLIAITETLQTTWEGSGKELHQLLPRPNEDRYWPEPRGMAGKLRRVAPDLRKSGWQVTEIKPTAESKRPKRWRLVPPDAHPSAADLAAVQFTRRMVQFDLHEWTERFSADGATEACAVQHAELARAGSSLECREATCTASWRPGYRAPVTHSQSLDSRLLSEMEDLGLTVADLDRLGDHVSQASMDVL